MAKTIQKIFKEYLCDVCEKDLHTLDGFPYVNDKDKIYCPECAVLNDIISAQEYVDITGQYGACYKGEITRENNLIVFHDSLGRKKQSIIIGDTWHG